MATTVIESTSRNIPLQPYVNPEVTSEPSSNIIENNIDSSSRNENNYHKEINRLKSYPLLWPHGLNKRDLAKDGFYFAISVLQCFFCSLELSLNTVCSNLNLLHRERRDCNFAHGRETTPANVALENTTDFRYEINRYISFLGANWYAPVDPEDLAKWGFYWTGSLDVGRCNFCRLEVRGWEQNDRGQSEHMRWNPHCPFMQNRAVGNVRIGEEHNASSIADDALVTVPRGLINLQNGVSAEETGVMLITPPRHPEYSSVSTRQGSYSMWPLSMRQRPEQLAEAGFYYTSKGDRVICFQCGGGLKDWGQQDLPWVEHAVWFPRCAYLVLKKGREFVAQVQALKNAQINNPGDIMSIQPVIINPSPVNSMSSVPCSVQANSAAVTTPIIQQSMIVSDSINSSTGNNTGPSISNDTTTDVTSDMRVCKVCYQNDLGIVFLPCGHMATCPDCAPQLSACPICRAPTTAYVRAFLP